MTRLQQAFAAANAQGRGDKDMGNVSGWKARHPDYRFRPLSK